MTVLVRSRLGVYRLLLRIVRSLRSHLGLEKTTYVQQRVPEYRRYWEQAASDLSADFRVLSESIWEVSRGGARTRLANYVTEFDDPVTLALAGDKPLIYRLAQAERVPVPEYVVVDPGAPRLALDFHRNSGPCVVKPARDTSSGLGVTTYVTSRRGLLWAIARASMFCPEVMVEALVPGESYRLLFLEGRMIHAVRRRGTRVTGDGIGTVRQLVTRAHRARLDRIGELTLAAQGLSADAVPPAGASVLVRGLPAGETRQRELRTVYDEDVTALIAADVVVQLLPLVRRVGASFAGVDVVSVDPALPLRPGAAAMIEINTTPGIHHHHVPGTPAERFAVAEVVLERLLARAVRDAQSARAAIATAPLEAGR
ncbi:MAG: hypothetical protein IH616_24410 [Gemmatimonadales bacterium]|nr:hypothetical protein [Gemmatimonadales bacterium]